MPLVDGKVDGLAHGAAGMMQEGAGIGEFHEILEVADRAVATAAFEIGDEWRAVRRRKDEAVAADEDAARWISRMLNETRRRGRLDDRAREARRKVQAITVAPRAGFLKKLQRNVVAANFEADRFQNPVGMRLDAAQTLLGKKFVRRNDPFDIGGRRARPLRAGALAALSSAGARASTFRRIHERPPRPHHISRRNLAGEALVPRG